MNWRFVTKKAKIKLENLGPHTRLSDRDYAIMAAAVYDDKLEQGQVLRYKNYSLAKGIKVLHTWRGFEYFGAAFIRISKRGKDLYVDLILAHRGTDDLIDIAKGWTSLIFGGDSGQYTSPLRARFFTRDIIYALGLRKGKNVRLPNGFSNIHIRITHVGHSLGGALARIAATEFNHHAVVFEAASVEHVADRIKKRNLGSKAKSFQAFNVADSIVSQPRSKRVPQRICFANDYEDFITDQHSMERIIKRCFDASGGFLDADIPQLDKARKKFVEKQQLMDKLIHTRWP